MKHYSSKHLAVLSAAAGLGVAAASGYGAPIAWNPPVAGSSSWTNGTNWDGGNVPTNDTTTDTAVFNNTVYNFQPVLDANTVQSVNGLQFGDGSTVAAALTLGTTASATSGQTTGASASGGSTTITLSDASSVVVGLQVTGSKIPTGTFVTGVSGNDITISQPVSGTLNSGTQLTFNSSLQIGSGGVTVASAVGGIQEIAAPVVLAGNQTWTDNSTRSKALSITGGIYLGSNTLTLSGATGSSIYLPNSGALSGAGSLVIDTAGIVTFGGTRPNNPFTGGVTLNAGTIVFSGGSSGGGGGAGALGTGVLTINGGSLNGSGNMAGHALTVSGQVWNADWTYQNSKTLDMGTGAISLGTAPGTNRTVTVDNGNGVYLILGGAISNGTTANAFTKAGAGPLYLNGDSDYTGATTVIGGALLMNGTTTGQGNYTLAANTTLGGTGTVGLGAGSNVSIASTGHLAPGGIVASYSVTGVLSVSGSQTGTPTAGTGTVNLAGGSSFDMDLAGTTAGSDYDQLNLIGTIDLGGAALNVNLTIPTSKGNPDFTYQLGDNEFFTLIQNDGSDAILGTFAGLPEGATVLTDPNSGYKLFITYTGENNALSGTGNDVVLYTHQAVPEPATLGLLGVAGLGILLRRRRA